MENFVVGGLEKCGIAKRFPSPYGGRLFQPSVQAATKAGAGVVHAKSGRLLGMNALAGLVRTRQGRVLVFALMSGVKGDNVRAPVLLDNLAAALRGCGCTG